MKIEKIAKKKQKELTFKDLKPGDLFRLKTARGFWSPISMKVTSPFEGGYNAVDIEENCLKSWCGFEEVILVKATLKEEV